MLTKIYTTRPTTTYDFDNAGGVIVMVRSVIRSVCLNVRRITRKRVNGCRPNMVGKDKV